MAHHVFSFPRTNDALQYSPTNASSFSSNGTTNGDDFSFLDKTDYDVYDVCNEGKNCNKTYGSFGFDYYDFEEMLSQSTTPPNNVSSTEKESTVKTRKKRALRSSLKKLKYPTTIRDKRDAATSSKTKLYPLPVPQFTIGAGKQLGLSVLLDAETEEYFVTSGLFVGFKVLEKPIFVSRSKGSLLVHRS